jgi:hypothetical protein
MATFFRVGLVGICSPDNDGLDEMKAILPKIIPEADPKDLIIISAEEFNTLKPEVEKKFKFDVPAALPPMHLFDYSKPVHPKHWRKRAPKFRR